VPERRDKLFGRRRGKPLSPRRAGLLESELPKLAVDTGRTAPADLASVFPGSPKRLRLEVGFGGGEHLIARAAREPDAGFIGVEPFVNGMAKAVAAIVDGGITNVRVFGGEASVLLDWIPSASLESIDLLYPDPWPKKRHWKRRFVSAENLDRMARVLKPDGALRFVSDIPSYVAWTLALVARREDFVWPAERAADWTTPFPGWPGTRYEQKALKAGRTPTYLRFLRVSKASSH
jgi:tRNA (guanine-N7-)-methyltransferase